MATYNGISIIPQNNWSSLDSVIATVACLVGCGGYCKTLGYFFHTKYPDDILQHHFDINMLELLTISVALKLWGHALKGQRIQVYCDNLVSVYVINTGRARHNNLIACLREIAFICATSEIQLKAVHISSKSNRWADFLSRVEADAGNLQLFQKEIDFSATDMVVDSKLFRFTADW